MEVFFLECLHQGQPWSDVFCESKLMADNVEIQFVDEISDFQNEEK